MQTRDVSRATRKSNGSVPAAGEATLNLSELLRALQTVRDGHFSVRLASDQTGLAGKVADTFMALRSAGLVFCALLFLVPTARAQQYYGGPARPDDRPVSWHVMGGLNQPVGNTDNILQSGWNVGGGVTFHQPGSPLAFRVDLDYASNNAARSLLDQGQASTGLQITGGWADILSATANAELRMPFSPNVYGYLIGGVGGYYTRISLTQYGYGYVCDPWWGFCYIATGDLIVAEHDVTKFGWNAGAGIAFRLRSGSTLFVEARYNAVQMPQTFEFVPVVVGLRF